MKRIAILILSVAGVAGAQTISPVTAECGRKCSGSFTIQSNALVPMVVTVEPYSFALDGNGKHFRPLDWTTRVQLSQTSARLGPKETHEFSYRIRCDLLPCEVSFLAGMVVGHTRGDRDHPVMQVRLILDHAVYVCEKARNCRKSVLDGSGYKPAQVKSAGAKP